MKAILLFITFVITSIIFVFLVTEEEIQIFPACFTAYLSMVSVFLMYHECKPTKTK